MPHLSGYGELGLMIFGGAFGIGYLLSAPRLGMAKMALLVMFVRVISVQNEQTYSFLSYADAAVMTALVGALLVAIPYIPTSPRPEKVFLRLFRRFFRHAGFLISELGRDGKRKRGIAGRLKAILYRNELLELPGKLAACAQKIDYRAFPANTPERVQALVSSLYVLALEINDLVEAHPYPQADLLERAVDDEVRAWRQTAETRLQLRAEDPALATEPGADGRDQLMARLARLEARVDETLAQAGEGELSIEDLKNFYRLLGSYRGLSEAGVDFRRVAADIDWAQWQAARF
jgi:hypothetical protein